MYSFACQCLHASCRPCPWLVLFTKAGSYKRSSDDLLCQEAAGNGAGLVVLPEMFSTPYSNECFQVRRRACCGQAPSN